MSFQKRKMTITEKIGMKNARIALKKTSDGRKIATPASYKNKCTFNEAVKGEEGCCCLTH